LRHGSSQPKYTVAQQNAISSAKTYLSMGSGFSRYSLIAAQLEGRVRLHGSTGDLRSQQGRPLTYVGRWAPMYDMLPSADSPEPARSSVLAPRVRV
jgi:hypothetical protein